MKKGRGGKWGGGETRGSFQITRTTSHRTSVFSVSSFSLLCVRQAFSLFFHVRQSKKHANNPSKTKNRSPERSQSSHKINKNRMILKIINNNQLLYNRIFVSNYLISNITNTTINQNISNEVSSFSLSRARVWFDCLCPPNHLRAP